MKRVLKTIIILLLASILTGAGYILLYITNDVYDKIYSSS
jgi:hypothetical protein